MSKGFLVLSRAVDESIMVGEPGTVLTFPDGRTLTLTEPIQVMQLRSKDGKTQIGVKAPKAIPVHRSEVYEQKRAA